MNRERRTLVAVVVFAMAVSVGAIVALMAFHTSRSDSANACTQYATEQLPPAVVRQVNAERVKYHLKGGDEDTATLKTRPLGSDWQAEAFAVFMPQYCGFSSNINDKPVTEAGRSGKADSYGDDADRVIFTNDTTPKGADGSIVCISNAVPTVTLEQGALVMRGNCDRRYPQATWMQSDPQLVVVPSATGH
jgi:hypothetical protein